MISALLNGLVGLALCLGVGLYYVDLLPEEILYCVLVSNGAALVALLVTLKAEKYPWFKKKFNRTLKTWGFLASLYYGMLLLLCPVLRDMQILLKMAFPLLISTGFCILVFGPIQDYFVRQAQRRARKQEAYRNSNLPISR